MTQHHLPCPTLFPYTTLFRSATEQRVGRAGAPAGEDDAVDADRGDREHEQHRDGDVGDLQRRVVAEHPDRAAERDRKSTRLNSSHRSISYAVFCLKKRKKMCV